MSLVTIPLVLLFIADSVMTQFVIALLKAGNMKEKIASEMSDRESSYGDACKTGLIPVVANDSGLSSFADWVSDKFNDILTLTATVDTTAAEEFSTKTTQSSSPMTSIKGAANRGGNRLLSSALGGLSHGEKRKLEDRPEGQNKKRVELLPEGPRADKRTLGERLAPGPSHGVSQGDMLLRGMGGNRGRGGIPTGEWITSKPICD